MKTLLQINTSLFSGEGQSSRLANQFVAAWRASHPEADVIVRDLGAEPIPHLTADRFSALVAKPETRTPEQQVVAQLSDRLIEEIRAAELVVLGLPMYNFGIPSTLKAYFDHVARAGVTFRYTENGPVGLLGGRKVLVFAARGGLYQGTPLDTQTDYIRNFLAFLGMTDVEFIYAEGLAMGESGKQTALNQAAEKIRSLATPADTALAAT